jgi:lipase ATG15
MQIFLVALWFHFVAALSVPDATNKTLILSLAELSANAYHEPKERNTTLWRNSTEMWRYVSSYGWEIDGLRGHVFAHRVDKLLVVSVKGTTLNNDKDKESANLLCSCNCCYSNCTDACNRDRLLQSLPNMYLTLLLSFHENLEKEFPDYEIWFTGHSMGAVIATLAAVKTCRPAVGYSSPGEQLFASRIGLHHDCTDEQPPIYHVGFDQDPIYTGNCKWLCWMAGYRMDSLCHHGYECVYSDSVDDDSNSEQRLQIQESIGAHGGLRDLGSGWIYTHTANYLIDKVIIPNENVPSCRPVENCSERCVDVF